MDGRKHEKQLTFHQHVHELRKRLVWPALILVVAGSVAYAFHNIIIDFLKAPFDQNLYYDTPAGGFNFIMKVCFLVGVTLAIPALIYNIITFLEPAIEKMVSKKLIAAITLLSLTLGLGGAAFAYYFVIPTSLEFFGDFNVNGVSPLISADNYLNFILMCILTFILLFQVPLLMLFINHIKPLQPKKLLKYERHVIVGSLAFALILPFTYDPITQFLIALPIILLYNLSVLLVLIANRKRTKTQKNIHTSHPTPHRTHNAKPAQVMHAKPVVVHKPQTLIPQPLFQNDIARQVRQVKRQVIDVTGEKGLPRTNFLDLAQSQRANFLDLRKAS